MRLEVFRMKQKYVPLDKRSKKQQREFHLQQRKDWGSLSPVTRALPNAKAYNRQKARRWEHNSEPLSGFFVFWQGKRYVRPSIERTAPTQRSKGGVAIA